MTYVVPDAARIRELSSVDFTALGYEIDTTPDPDTDELDGVVLGAAAYIAVMTCRSPLADNVPDELAPLFDQAIQMRVEQIAFQGQESSVENSADSGIKSFSAGSYSETRADESNRFKRGSLNPWRELDDLLWMLMTDECEAKWQAQLEGTFAPAFDVTEVDWDNRHGWVEPGGF